MTEVTEKLPVTQKNLLDVAGQHDAQEMSRQIKFGKAVLNVPRELPVKPPPAHELDLTDRTVADPFGGNINNRKVAERIGGEKKQWLNPHAVTHKGDPVKAREDVQLSKQINPDSLSPQEAAEVVQNEDAAKRTPTPGSPAAQKQMQPTGGAPVWNAPKTPGT